VINPWRRTAWTAPRSADVRRALSNVGTVGTLGRGTADTSQLRRMFAAASKAWACGPAPLPAYDSISPADNAAAFVQAVRDFGSAPVPSFQGGVAGIMTARHPADVDRSATEG